MINMNNLKVIRPDGYGSAVNSSIRYYNLQTQTYALI